MSDRSVNRWIQLETNRHVELLSKMREKLEQALETRQELDADGVSSVVPADVTPAGTPNRHWCRAFARYQSGFIAVVGQEQERAKMLLLAKRAGMATLTDDEYEREMLELGREAVRELSAEEFEQEARRRGARLLTTVGPTDQD